MTFVSRRTERARLAEEYGKCARAFLIATRHNIHTHALPWVSHCNACASLGYLVHNQTSMCKPGLEDAPVCHLRCRAPFHGWHGAVYCLSRCNRQRRGNGKYMLGLTPSQSLRCKPTQLRCSPTNPLSLAVLTRTLCPSLYCLFGY